MLYLKNDRLYVEVAEPGEMPNHTFRFDRAGFVSEVVLDGDTRFCANEPKILVHPSSGGRGLCSELKCDCDLEAAVGEYFPKFGVGLLLKDADEPYCFHKKYVEKPFDIAVEREGDGKLVFRTAPAPCNGYALRQEKVLEIRDNTLSMTHTLANAGEKHVSIQEYNHNMMSFDGMAIGPDYEIEFKDIAPLPVGTLPEAYEGYAQNFEAVAGDRIRVRRYTNVASVYEMPAEYLVPCERFRWTQLHRGAGVAVDGVDGFAPVQLNLWTVDHLLSVESFHAIELAPGQTETWTRSWTFRYL